MLAKGKLRADAEKLAAYLIKGHAGTRAELVEVRGFAPIDVCITSRDAEIQAGGRKSEASADIADPQENSLRAAPFHHLPDGFGSTNLATAFRDVVSQAQQSGTGAPFFHLVTRLAPGDFLLPAQWADVADREEKCLGFISQPRAVAFQHLSDYSVHMHIVWSRIACRDDGRRYAIDPGPVEDKLKKMCRQLECELGITEIRGIKAVEPYVPVRLWKWVRWQKKRKKTATLLEFNQFIAEPHPRLGAKGCKTLRDRYLRAHLDIPCTHTHAEILAVTRAILDTPPQVSGVVVEAGCFKGGSTAKLSIVAKLTGRKLVVFDSFAGLPESPNSDDRMDFYVGEYAGTLDEVRDNVKRYGEISACEFRQGWFSDTMPSFTEPVAVAFVDVDLSDSVRTCLKYLYPLVVPGGIVFSHDGHIPTCVAVMQDRSFWKDEVGAEAPLIPSLGEEKFLRIEKP